MQIGYSTGTFDLPHQRHFEVLQFMKAYCDHLVIGLTSDELAEKQKRKPYMSFEQRKSILLATKWVDAVVKHDGATKLTDWEKIRFNVLLIGDEYFGSDEYRRFTKTPVVYVPKTMADVHTSHAIVGIEQSVVQQMSVVATGISGPLLQLKTHDSWLVIKPVHVGAVEAQHCFAKDALGKSMKTANCYQLPFPHVPRNWRRLGPVGQKHPNIAGVNAYRELEFHRLVQRPWIPVLTVKQVFCTQRPGHLVMDPNIVTDRMFPAEIYWLYMQHRGTTLYDWTVEHSSDIGVQQRFMAIVGQVFDMIQDLRANDLLHGDIHAHNVLVDEKDRVSLIDFGWCYHPSFYLVGDELEYYRSLLSKNFDLVHFYEALEHDFSSYDWFPTQFKCSMLA